MIKYPLPAEVRAKALALMAAGLSCRETAAELNIALGTIKSWKQRQKKIDARPLAPVVAKIVPAEDEPIDDDLAGRQAEYVDRLSRTAVRFARFVDQLDGEAVTRNADKILKCDRTSRAALKLDNDRPMPVINLAVLCGGNGPARAAQALVKPRLRAEAESD